MHRELRLLLALFMGAFLFAGSAAGQVGTGVNVGGGARSHAGTDGVDYDVGYSGRAYVDPGVIEGYEIALTQIVIIALDPTLESQVLERIRLLGLDHEFYRNLHMVALNLPRDHFEDIRGLPGVLVLYRNEKMEPYLDKSAHYIGAPVVWNTYKDTGAKATIMVVDSGIDGTHPDVRLGANLLQNVLVTPGVGNRLPTLAQENVAMTDFDGHGTHVASIAAGTSAAENSGGRYKGIAPGAKLVGYTAGLVDRETGEVSFESQTVLKAFDYAISKSESFSPPIRVVTNSWGANGEFDVFSPVNIATLQMYKKGLTVIFAAGNEGSAGHTMNKYSVAPWVLSVAAGDVITNSLARFSSRGSDKLPYDHPDVMAPGVGITAAKAIAGTTDATAMQVKTGSYVVKSGTSMAAPHVAGIAALLYSAPHPGGELSPDQIMDIITGSVTPVTKYELWEAGAGYVNALSAYKLATKTVGMRDEFLSGKVKYGGRETGDPRFEKDPVSVGYGEGAAIQLRSGQQSIGEFGESLVGSVNGIVFLVGTSLLAFAAFGLRRKPGLA